MTNMELVRYRKKPTYVMARGPIEAEEIVETLEGTVTASVGYYVLTATVAPFETWSVRGDIFQERYELDT